MRELDWAVTPSAEGAAGGRGRAENSDAIASTTIIRSTMAKLNIRATSNLPLLLQFDSDPSTRRTACRWGRPSSISRWPREALQLRAEGRMRDRSCETLVSFSAKVLPRRGAFHCGDHEGGRSRCAGRPPAWSWRRMLREIRRRSRSTDRTRTFTIAPTFAT